MGGRVPRHALPDRLPVVDVQESLVHEDALPHVFVLVPPRPPRPRRARRHEAPQHLEARLLVAAQDAVVRPERRAPPPPPVQVEHGPRPLQELGRVARSDSHPGPPRPDRVLRQPLPDRRLARARVEELRRLPAHVGE